MDVHELLQASPMCRVTGVEHVSQNEQDRRDMVEREAQMDAELLHLAADAFSDTDSDESLPAFRLFNANRYISSPENDN